MRRSMEVSYSGLECEAKPSYSAWKTGLRRYSGRHPPPTCPNLRGTAANPSVRGRSSHLPEEHVQDDVAWFDVPLQAPPAHATELVDGACVTAGPASRPRSSPNRPAVLDSSPLLAARRRGFCRPSMAPRMHPA